jgi:flagellar basal body-associated protein FliL
MKKVKKKNKFLIIGRIVFLFLMVMVIALVVAISKMNKDTLRENILGVLRSATGMPIEI